MMSTSNCNEIPPSSSSATDSQNPQEEEPSKSGRRKRRWGDAPGATSAGGVGTTVAAAPPAILIEDETHSTTSAKRSKPEDRAALLKQSIAARLAALKQQPKPRAKVYEIDFKSVKPTFQEEASQINNEKPPSKPNPYLTRHPHPPDEEEAGDDDDNDEVLLDGRLAGGRTAKRRSRFKPLTFIEPGTFEKIGERKRLKAALAEKSGFSSGRKEGTFVKAIGMVTTGVHTTTGTSDIILEDQSSSLSLKLRIEEDPSYTYCPIAMEWWDAELLPKEMRTELAVKEKQQMTKILAAAKQKRMAAAESTTGGVGEGEQDEHEQFAELCFQSASIQNVKTSALVQHPPPIKTAASMESGKKIPVLHLTKQEMKRQRKLTRAEKQREQQDMQAAGLIPPPEPRLTFANFMKVLGDQAVMDPSQMEAVVMKQVQARKLKHEQMNMERALTPAQKKEKRARKLLEQDSSSVHVALFLVKDMSHRYHRTKVDLNAQQNSITGGVLECQSSPELALVIAEGGPKAIKRYIRLMTVRMKWRGENMLEGGADESDSEDEMMDGTASNEGDESAVQKFNPNNSCQLVWTGMAVKRIFKSFVFQTCATSELARKVLEAKGVAHYWDQVITFARSSSSSSAVKFKLLDREEEHLEQQRKDDEEEMVE